MTRKEHKQISAPPESFWDLAAKLLGTFLGTVVQGFFHITGALLAAKLWGII
jgi:hypothetical protein